MNKHDIVIHKLPLEITNYIIKDFKIDLECIEYFPQHKTKFINNIEFELLLRSFHKNKFYDMLLFMEHYNTCTYFQGLEISRITCIRDICEYIDLYDYNLKSLYYHINCPNYFKNDIKIFYSYSDYEL